MSLRLELSTPRIEVTQTLSVARLLCIVLQYCVSIKQLADLLTGDQFGPYGQVSGHDRLMYCSKRADLSAGVKWSGIAAESSSRTCRGSHQRNKTKRSIP